MDTGQSFGPPRQFSGPRPRQVVRSGGTRPNDYDVTMIHAQQLRRQSFRWDPIPPSQTSSPRLRGMPPRRSARVHTPVPPLRFFWRGRRAGPPIIFAARRRLGGGRIRRAAAWARRTPPHGCERRHLHGVPALVAERPGGSGWGQVIRPGRRAGRTSNPRPDAERGGSPPGSGTWLAARRARRRPSRNFRVSRRACIKQRRDGYEVEGSGPNGWRLQIDRRLGSSTQACSLLGPPGKLGVFTP